MFSYDRYIKNGNGSKLHEGTKLHEKKIARVHEDKNAQNCKKIILHKLYFCTRVKKTKKNNKKQKDKLIKKQKEKNELLTKGKG